MFLCEKIHDFAALFALEANRAQRMQAVCSAALIRAHARSPASFTLGSGRGLTRTRRAALYADLICQMIKVSRINPFPYMPH